MEETPAQRVLRISEKVHRISEQERQVTTDAINALPVSEQAKADIVQLWRRVQRSVNSYAADQDREMDERVIPELFRLFADEHGRVLRRLKSE